MANINALFPTKYIKAADLNGQDAPLQIAGLTMEEVDEGEQKPVVRFVNHPQGLVLNKTNALVIAEMYGDDYDRWSGRTITLYATKCDMAGKRVDCIRVRSGMPQQPPVGPNFAQMPPVPPQPSPYPQPGWGQQPPPLPPQAGWPQQPFGQTPPAVPQQPPQPPQPPHSNGGYYQ
jgi:hypothetical protein